MRRRNNRQDAIREIVRDKSIRTQRALVDELRALGFSCTQATVSRDVADMGLCKLAEGVYVLAEDLHLQRMLSEFVVRVLRAENLVVVRCQPGTASGVAAAIDDADLAHALGSVAGNDTVLVIADSSQAAESLQALVAKLANAR
ncbi:arginine repressor [Olsenella sp. An188]|uniref:arginine repressor n=1 Tax=Olsenella sp. An188 TaxID=1965579 RepID=UPI000B3AACBA|nr:ArgR family transcriptional regulator [Olsenella sp. An188]OUP39179.1 ArgR family transcriptional regulator [Olsenella sp. An188]